MTNVAWAGLFTFLSIAVVVLGYGLLNSLTFRREQRRRVIERLSHTYIDNGIEPAIVQMERFFGLLVVLTVGDPEPEMRGMLDADSIMQEIAESIVGEAAMPGLMLLPEEYSLEVSNVVYAVLDGTRLEQSRERFSEEQKQAAGTLTMEVIDKCSDVIKAYKNIYHRMLDVIWSQKTFQDIHQAIIDDKELNDIHAEIGEAMEFLNTVGSKSSSILFSKPTGGV